MHCNVYGIEPRNVLCIDVEQNGQESLTLIVSKIKSILTFVFSANSYILLQAPFSLNSCYECIYSFCSDRSTSCSISKQLNAMQHVQAVSRRSQRALTEGSC